MSCTNFLIWQLGCKSDTSPVVVHPEAVARLVNIIYATFPQSIKPVTVEGYHIIDILGGSEICPSSFNPQNLVRIDRLTHEFTPDQITLLRTLVENLIVQSSRNNIGSLNVYLARNGLTMNSLLSLLHQEIEKVISPPVIDLLLTTTQPQSLALPVSLNTGTLKDGLCKVNSQLPIIIFSASLLERLTKSILSNDTFHTLLTGMGNFSEKYRDPLDPSHQNSSSREVSVSSNLFWLILIGGIILIIAVLLYVSRS